MPQASKPVRKAVFPVAGMGTRFLPATKAVPKEMLPVVDKPVIQYAVEEAREAGIEQFVFITGRGKHVIADHFDHAYELESLLEARDKTAELNSLLETLPKTGSVGLIRQQQPLGLGHAVWCARHFVGNEPFAVLLPDDLMVGKPGALSQMMMAYREVGGGIIVAAEEKPRERGQALWRGGSRRGQGQHHRGQGRGGKARSRQGAVQSLRHRPLHPAAGNFRHPGPQERGAGNEIQLTDAMAQMIGKMPFHAVKTDCARYDCGDKVGFLHANIAVGLSRPDIAPQLIKKILKG